MCVETPKAWLEMSTELFTPSLKDRCIDIQTKDKINTNMIIIIQSSTSQISSPFPSSLALPF